MLNIELPYDPTIPLQEELKTPSHTKTCTGMFIPAYSEQSQIEPSPDVHQLIINKQIVIYPYSEIISAVKKELLIL